MTNIILFEDKLGISDGYRDLWASLLLVHEFAGVNVIRRSAYRIFGKQLPLLIAKGNRKTPGFNPDGHVQNVLRSWVNQEIDFLKPIICLCMDPSILFLFNPDWNQSTIDTLRGGVYLHRKVPFVIMFPISAWHSKKKQKDIARLNDGYSDKEEWEAQQELDESDKEEADMHVWLDPVSVPYGKFVLHSDLAKANRVYKKRINANV